jgi:hypothetical protein
VARDGLTKILNPCIGIQEIPISQVKKTQNKTGEQTTVLVFSNVSALPLSLSDESGTKFVRAGKEQFPVT